MVALLTTTALAILAAATSTTTAATSTRATATARARARAITSFSRRSLAHGLPTATEQAGGRPGPGPGCSSLAVVRPADARSGPARPTRTAASASPGAGQHQDQDQDQHQDQDQVLYDIPVSNHGARVRMLLYAKGIEDAVRIESPSAIGGIKSDEFKRINPLGKMPVLILGDGTALPESTVILRYLDAKYAHPSFTPTGLEQRARSELFAQIVDGYITPIQGCMYRGPMDANSRAAQIKQMAGYLDLLEHVLSGPEAPGGTGDGPFCAGREPSLGDIVAYPTLVFADYILPRKFGWEDIFATRPGLRRWWGAMNRWEPAARVGGEVSAALKKWDDDGRWTKVGIQDQIRDLDQLVWAYQ